jgi:hypothetical protein
MIIRPNDKVIACSTCMHQKHGCTKRSNFCLWHEGDKKVYLDWSYAGEVNSDFSKRAKYHLWEPRYPSHDLPEELFEI